MASIAELILSTNRGGSAALRRDGASRAALWLEAPRARARGSRRSLTGKQFAQSGDSRSCFGVVS
jgi:hypothetical protein